MKKPDDLSTSRGTRVYLRFNNCKPLGKRVSLHSFKRGLMMRKHLFIFRKGTSLGTPKFVDYLLNQSFCGSVAGAAAGRVDGTEL
jgi:hypothetical protein